MGQKKENLFEENKKFIDDFGDLLCTYRRMTRLSQEKLAEVLEISSNTISETERGNRNSTVYNFYLFIHFFKISKEEVIKLLYDDKYIPDSIKQICK